MDLQSIPMFAMLREKMAWLTERQSVLADNVANADTPGYRARDLEAFDFEALVRQSSAPAVPATGATRAGHIPLTAGAGARGFGVVESRENASPTGNSVALEDQMMRVADTAMEYQAAAGLYKKALGLIRIAIGSR